MKKLVLFLLSIFIVFSFCCKKSIYALDDAYTLKSRDSWYPENSTVPKGDITKIIFSNDYVETGNEIYVFNCDVNDEGKIKGFVNGSELTIATVPAGKTIYANSDSDELFTKFYSLSTIENLSLLNLSNVESISAWFWDVGCNSESLDIDMSDLDFSNTHNFSHFINGLGQTLDHGTKLKNINFTFKDQTIDLYADSSFSFGSEGLYYPENTDLKVNYDFSGNTFYLKDNSYGFNCLSSYWWINDSNRILGDKFYVDCKNWNVINNNDDLKNIFDHALFYCASRFNEVSYDFSNMTISGSCETSLDNFADTFEVYSPNFKIDFSNLNAENLVSVAYMFYGAKIENTDANIYIDLSNWNTPNLKDMTSMFENFGGSDFFGDNINPNIVIDMTNFDTSNVTCMDNAFNFSSNIKTENITIKLPKKSGNVENTSNRLYGKDETVYYEFSDESNFEVIYTNKITYHLGNGSFADGSEDVFVGNDGETYNLNINVKSNDSNYKFVGWYLNEDLSGSSINSIELLNDIDLWAKYEKIENEKEHIDDHKTYEYRIPKTGIK